MKKLTFKYKKGPYPTTRQGYVNEYELDLFSELKENFINFFKLDKDPYHVKEIQQSYKCWANNSAYFIYDPNSKEVIDLAFINLYDFVWLLQVLDVEDVEFMIPEKVYDAVKSEFDELKDRIYLMDKKK